MPKHKKTAALKTKIKRRLNNMYMVHFLYRSSLTIYYLMVSARSSWYWCCQFLI